ncbi:MAG TPA: histidine--tRNA ligase [Halanaerobiales bacterium]|nr:histidine--tRNA ligase [Halanaerobiales bacterium]
MKIKAPRGTNDILPPLSLQWQYIEALARKILSLYNYQQIRIPIFEYTELFQRGIGETTDIVEKEMYTFSDKSGRSITLRPEGTASVVRAYLENKIYGKAQPVKYYYIGPMFRYERPQAGRYRQFHQLGIEVFGSNDPALDAEVIYLGLNILEELGLNDLEAYVNSIGCLQCRGKYLQKLKEFLNDKQELLCSDCSNRIERNPLRVFDCKNENCSMVINGAPRIIDQLCTKCHLHFQKTRDYLDELQVKYTVDPVLVRGLDYYTNTAFEIKFNKLGAQDTIFAGGRYNGLVKEIGNKSVPGIGFAIGLERLLLTLEEQGIKVPVKESTDLYVITIGERAKKTAFNFVHKLRKAGLKAEIDYLDRSVKAQMKAADRINSLYTIILGDNELKEGNATVRNMKNGEQIEIKLDLLVETMQKMI